MSATDHPQPALCGIDHVQLAIPCDGEEVARTFYVDLLGLVEVPKPTALAGRGGCWFELGATRLHLGVEDDFRPARKAHPALLVDRLDAFVVARGLAFTWADEVPDLVHGYVDDPFGNRIELVESIAPATSRSAR